MKITNSTDEVLNSNGIVDVYYDEATREVKVEDTGRGIPQERLQELCEVLHSSGKFSKGDEQAYNVSGGMNGVGMKICVYLSEYCDVTSIRDGKSVTRSYEDGILKNVKETKESKSKHGTIVSFKISDKYMSQTDKVTCKRIQDMIEQKTDVCEGLKVKFHGVNIKGKEIEKTYEGLNIMELMSKYMKPTSKIWDFKFSDKKSTFSIAFGYDARETDGSNLMGWTNYIYNSDGGKHVEALADTLYDVFRKYMLKSYFSDKDKKNYQIKKEDVRLGLNGVVVVQTSKDPTFYGQFKQRVDAEWIHEDISSMLTKALNKLSDGDMRTISGIIKNNIKARLSSQRARQQVKKVGNGLSKDKIDKYFPAKMKCDTDYRELYLTEGLSAGGQAEKSRFEFQEIYMLRGKVDNIYDIPLNELTKIDIIDDLSRIIGLVPGKRGKINQDRILGLTDAD